MDATSTTDIWPAVHAERVALAADLADLSDEQWATRRCARGTACGRCSRT